MRGNGTGLGHPRGDGRPILGARWRAALAAGVLALAAGGLAVGGVHELRAAADQASDQQVAQANLGNRYYSCLAAQARSLVRPGQVVKVSTTNPGNWSTLSKAVAPWTVMTNDADRAVAVLSLGPARGHDACLGSAVFARYHDGVVRRGSGGSLPGHGPPPATPL